MAPTFRMRRISAIIAGVTAVSLFAGLSTANAQTNPSSEQLASGSTYAQTSESAQSGVEAVIARAESQIGTPYAWGGGNDFGPTQGVRDGGIADAHGDYSLAGFDCSGLVKFAFAGAGVELPHFTGYQYLRGTPVPVSDIKRGDLLFYGPDGNSHVAIYLGDGTMIEAPGSGDVVKTSPIRWSGLSTNAVRLI